MPKPSRIEHFLEDPSALYFYNLIGGLADNLMSGGKYAGTFLSCDVCGDTFTLKPLILENFQSARALNAIGISSLS